jgi:hypothetical protein
MKRITQTFRAPISFWAGLLFLAAFGPPCLAQAPITNGLVARWSGDGNALDSAGHFDGQVSGGLRYVPGPTGLAFQFDGGAAQAPNPSGIFPGPGRLSQFNGGGAKVDFGAGVGNFGTRDFTIAYWMKTDSQYRHEAFLAKRTTCDGALSFLDIQVGSGGIPPAGVLVLHLAKGGFVVPDNLISSRPMNDGQWHHIVWVRQSTSAGSITYLLYVDGGLDVSAAFPEALDIGNESPLVLGHSVCECCDGCRPYAGAAAELQIFSHALSAEEILAIYKAGKPAQ